MLFRKKSVSNLCFFLLSIYQEFRGKRSHSFHKTGLNIDKELKKHQISILVNDHFDTEDEK